MKNIKQLIWQKLNEQGYILDQDIAKIYGKEPNFCVAESYKQQWRKFQNDKSRFDDENIIEKTKGNRKYLIRTEGMPEHSFYKVGKEFWETIKIK